jgi:hypothetical protein
MGTMMSCDHIVSGYVLHTKYGSFCSVSQSPLGFEEAEWDCCDACGGKGFEDDDELDYHVDNI